MGLFDKWLGAKNTATPSVVKVNISGINGIRIEEWTGVDKEMLDKYLDKSTRELYVGEYFKSGEKVQIMMKREQWDSFKNL